MSTPTAISMGNCKIEYSLNGTSWTDISGWANSVTVDGGERAVSEVFTFGRDSALLTMGPLTPVTVTVRAIYDEGTSAPYNAIRTAFDNPTSAAAFWVRWSPRGGGTGTQLYTASGILTSCQTPTGEKGSDTVLVEFSVRADKITRSTGS